MERKYLRILQYCCMDGGKCRKEIRKLAALWVLVTSVRQVSASTVWLGVLAKINTNKQAHRQSEWDRYRGSVCKRESKYRQQMTVNSKLFTASRCQLYTHSHPQHPATQQQHTHSRTPHTQSRHLSHRVAAWVNIWGQGKSFASQVFRNSWEWVFGAGDKSLAGNGSGERERSCREGRRRYRQLLSLVSDSVCEGRAGLGLWNCHQKWSLSLWLFCGV